MYTNSCRIFNKARTTTKRIYYENIFDTNEFNIKQTWLALKTIINRHKKIHNVATTFQLNETKIN